MMIGTPCPTRLLHEQPRGAPSRGERQQAQTSLEHARGFRNCAKQYLLPRIAFRHQRPGPIGGCVPLQLNISGEEVVKTYGEKEGT
jgi:hypothetical protein